MIPEAAPARNRGSRPRWSTPLRAPANWQGVANGRVVRCPEKPLFLPATAAGDCLGPLRQPICRPHLACNDIQRGRGGERFTPGDQPLQKPFPRRRAVINASILPASPREGPRRARQTTMTAAPMPSPLVCYICPSRNSSYSRHLHRSTEPMSFESRPHGCPCKPEFKKIPACSRAGWPTERPSWWAPPRQARIDTRGR